MGLVHGDERKLRRTGELGEARIDQALGSHVHEVVGTPGCPAQHLGLLSGRQRGIQVGPADARLLHGPNLVGHERHERAHDKGHAFHDDGGHLVAHRLAGAGGHDRQHVATGQQCRGHRLLTRPERVIAETARQHGPRLLHLLLHERSPAFSRSRFPKASIAGIGGAVVAAEPSPNRHKFPARSPRQPLRRRS